MFESKKHDREYGMQESSSADQANVPVTAVTVISRHSHCLLPHSAPPTIRNFTELTVKNIMKITLTNLIALLAMFSNASAYVDLSQLYHEVSSEPPGIRRKILCHFAAHLHSIVIDSFLLAF